MLVVKQSSIGCHAISVLAGNPTEPFSGSSDGTESTIESGAYEVILLDVPDQPQPGTAHYTWGFSEDCIGSIMPDETNRCIITVVYEPRSGPGGPAPINARLNPTLESLRIAD